MRELDAYYDHLPDEIKQLGVLQFATFPPSMLDNTVTQLWDKHMRPDWREIARGEESTVGKPRDEAQDRETVAELRGRLDEAQPVLGDEARLGLDAADYVVVRSKAGAGHEGQVEDGLEGSRGIGQRGLDGPALD